MVFGSSAADIYCVRFCWDEGYSWERGSSPPGPWLWGETMDRYLIEPGGRGGGGGGGGAGFEVEKKAARGLKSVSKPCFLESKRLGEWRPPRER